MKKEMNNKGFSLVELIVVIAIMAVLMAVLAPSLLRYVENSRKQKDASAASEILNAVNIALSSETINTEAVNAASGTPASVSIEVKSSDSTNDFGCDAVSLSSLKTELQASIGTSVKFNSKTYKDAIYKITIADDGSGAMKATGKWVDSSGNEISGS
jgi:prepilin-type N-terminal cleavage/methylation domain-containing protein